MDSLIEFEGRKPDWIPWSKDLDASIPYGEYVMRERPLFLLRTNKAIADKQWVVLKKQLITEIKPLDMVYVDLRKFGEAWAYQYELPNIPGEFDTFHVLEVTYTRWKSRGKLKIYGKVLLRDEEHVCDHYHHHRLGPKKGPGEKQQSLSSLSQNHHIITY